MAQSSPESTAGLESSVRALQERFGLIVAGKDLVRLLGYRTSAAFRQAVHRQSLGISTFFIPGRRGRCARTSDIARWTLANDAHQIQGSELKSTPGCHE